MKKIKPIIIIVLLLILIFLINKQIKNSKYLENFLIFNLYESQNNNKYIFDISSNSKKNANINLFSTLKMEGLTNKKIAPGSRGEFEIILKSSSRLKYNIWFESKNIKPQNLLFNVKNMKKMYNNIEEIELNGSLNVNTTKKFCIQWLWEYENDTYNNIQDTIDGENISEYNFDINITSYES